MQIENRGYEGYRKIKSYGDLVDALRTMDIYLGVLIVTVVDQGYLGPLGYLGQVALVLLYRGNFD